MAGTSRDLTYLGSPFGEGRADAYIFPQNTTPDYFVEALKVGREQKDKQEKAAAEQKAANEKAIKDWSVNYWLGHSSHFTQKAKDIYDEGVDLMAKGFNLGDPRSPEVASWIKKKHDTEVEAKNSTDYGVQAEKILNMTPADMQKYTKASLKAATDFYAKKPEYNSNIEAIQKQGFPTLVELQPMPEYIKNGKDITEFKSKMETEIMDAKTLKAQNEIRDKYKLLYKDAMKPILMSLNTADFDYENPADKEAAVDKFIQMRMEQITPAIKDFVTEKELAIKQQDANTRAGNLSLKRDAFAAGQRNAQKKYTEVDNLFENLANDVKNINTMNLSNLNILNKETGQMINTNDFTVVKDSTGKNKWLRFRYNKQDKDGNWVLANGTYDVPLVVDGKPAYDGSPIYNAKIEQSVKTKAPATNWAINDDGELELIDEDQATVGASTSSSKYNRQSKSDVQKGKGGASDDLSAFDKTGK